MHLTSVAAVLLSSRVEDKREYIVSRLMAASFGGHVAHGEAVM